MTTEKKIYFNKVKVITRNENGIEVPYLIRRTLFAVSKWFSIKIHKIIISDDVCTHDHPWAFFTIILKGGYYEWTPVFDQEAEPMIENYGDQSVQLRKLRTEKGHIVDVRQGSDGQPEAKRWHGPGSILYRPAKFRHQLELATDAAGNSIPATTFVITGKVIRKWGFFTRDGWKFHKDYDKHRDC